MVSAQTAHFSGSDSFLTTPTGLRNPYQVAVDSKGNIYIADSNNKRVIKETPSDDGFIESTVYSGIGEPYGVAVDAAGNVYIACDNLGSLIKESPSSPSGYVESTIGELYGATGVAVDSNGKIYVADNDVLMAETPSSGTYVQSQILFTGLSVNSVAVDSSLNVYITGYNESYDPVVWKLTPTDFGTYTQTVFETPGGLGITVGANGTIYIANGPYNSVDILTPSGGGYYTKTELPIDPIDSGYFYPTGVAVDGRGDVFFTDYFYDNLIEYSPGSGSAGTINVLSNYSAVSEFFTIDTAPATGSEAVTTQGSTSPQLDFSDAGYGSCISGGWYAGELCTVDITFTPTMAGSRYGSAVLYDASGNTIATGYMQGVGVAPLVNFSPGMAINENIASNGSAVAVDASGNLYTVAPGSSTAFIDTPGSGPSNWTESPIGSGLGSATGIAIDGGGNLYIADKQNGQVLKESLTSSGYSQSVVANQSNGLSQPAGVAVDGSGNVYISDVGNNKIYEETLTTGGYVQSVLATSTLSQPNSIAVDALGSVYIADTNNNRVLVEAFTESGYTESTIGTGVSSPTAVAVDGFGNVYISETAAGQVFKETLAGGSYVQSTIASGLQPYGLALDGSLNLYIAGSSSQQLVKLDVSDGPALSFAATTVGQVSSDSPKTVTVTNTGNAMLTLSALSYPIDFPEASGSNLCTGTISLNAGVSCNLPIEFAPQTIGSPLSEDVTLTDNNLNASPGVMQSISLSGTSTAATVSIAEAFGAASIPVAGRTSLTITLTNSTSGTETGIAFSDSFPTGMTVASPSGLTNSCGGTASATTGGTTLTLSGGSLNGNASCTVVVNVTSVTPGTVTNTTGAVSFTGGSGGMASANLTVNQIAPIITLDAIPAMLNRGTSAGFTAVFTTSADAPAPTQLMSFYAGSTPLGTGTLSGSGTTYTATVSTADLPSGTQSITASYPGDADYTTASSSGQSTYVNANNLWIGDTGNRTSAFSATGSAYLSTARFGGGGGEAIDSQGDVWSLNTGPSTVTEFTNTGTTINPGYNGGGLSTPTSIAIDGSGNVWITNESNSITEFDSSGTPISDTGYVGGAGGSLNTPSSIAIDISGNLWIANSNSNTVTEVLGAAAPTVPLATGVANNTTATKP